MAGNGGSNRLSTDDSIKVEIDDTELDAHIAKLQMAMSLSTEAFGTKDILKGAKSSVQEIKELKEGLDIATLLNEQNLPGINRELRLILGQLPGARQAIQAYFRLKRLVRGFDVGGWQMYITLIATAIIILKAVMEYQRKIERQQQEQENYIRREKGFSHDEYVKWKSDADAYFRSKPG